MNYKYRKRQIFGKRLNLPQDILDKVYNRKLSLNEFIEYELDDKIPISCIVEEDRKIVEKFGVDKCKGLDWELINSGPFARDALMSIDSQTKDINMALYELVKDQMIPITYSSKMKKVYSNRLLVIPQNSDEDFRNIANAFNMGVINLKQIITNWDLFKNKDLSYCLLEDSANETHITDTELKEFMSSYGNLASLIVDHDDIYTFIRTISNLNTEEEKHVYVKQFTDVILSNVYKIDENSRSIIKPTNAEFREIFKYSSMEDYLKKFNEGAPPNLIEELKTLPQDYVFNIPIPFSELINPKILSFVGTYGLGNVVDFDHACGHFFTKNNCAMLDLIGDIYLYYLKNEQDSSKSIFTKKLYDENGNYNNRPYTKDEFYEAMSRLIRYGLINTNFSDQVLDYRDITGEFRDRNADFFLSEQAPEELQEAFYNRTISSEFILSNPAYREFLKHVDLEIVFRYIPVHVINDEEKYVNLVGGIKQIFGSDDALDVMLLYEKYIRKVFDDTRLQNFVFNPAFTKDALLDEFDKVILQDIIAGNMKYDESIPSHFKNNNPTLFLSPNVPQEIRNKFYNREFTLKDFSDHPELLEMFDHTNIACGFSESLSWVIPLFSDSDDLKTTNYKRLKVISAYSKIQDVALQKAFKEYTMEFGANIDIEKIEYLSEVLSRLSLSNSSEIFTFRQEIATQILKSNNPLENLSKIEDIFIKNNIPIVGKLYSCFEILHPDFQGFDFVDSMISPVLKRSSTTSKKIIVFSDLIKASFGSNNRSVRAYLQNIELGSRLYESIKAREISFDSLGESEKKELVVFSKHLATLYNHTRKAKTEKETFTSTGDVLTDILELSKKLSPNGTLDYNLGDRVIRMFCGFAGIDTLAQAKEYMEEKVKTADARNKEAAASDMVLEQGDFIKGIGDITYLRNILQNGSVAHEFLGSSAGSDFTPLDTDASMIMRTDGTIREKISETMASGYGPIWFVLKNDDRFLLTRTDTETSDTKRDLSKLEVFCTESLESGHYGIRTGFASSEINYIVMENYDARVGLEIAMNGFYIPVANTDGKIVFTPKDYDALRRKMSGLSYFGEDEYIFSESLIIEETQGLAEQIEKSNQEVQMKQEKINHMIKKSLEALGLRLKTTIDGDLTEGFVEFIDTGSTGRGTNKPGDGDFDFMMRLDKTILSDPVRLEALKQTILKNLGRESSSELTGTGDFRLKSVQIDEDTTVDIDITFTEKTDKVSYSTDMALQDRLATIKKTDPAKYKYVVANILLAKQALKEAEVYKPNRGAIPQGGLGGVGIENWILQNGGSFVDAAISFVEAAEGKSFAEFQETYQIWDFGDNHLAERRGHYTHDNFVASNMSEAGYQKMVQALKSYLNNKGIKPIVEEGIKR